MKTPKFIEVTVLKIRHSENHPQFKELDEYVDYTKTDSGPYKCLVSTDHLENVFVEDAEDYLTALGFFECIYYIDESYDDIKYKLIGE